MKVKTGGFFFHLNFQHTKIKLHFPNKKIKKNLQVCLHNGIPIDPDFRDVTDETWDVEAMCAFVRDYMPYLEDKPSVIERCIYTVSLSHITRFAVTDPEFPRRGWGRTNSQGGGTNLLFGQIFPKNCMNMKEIGPGRASLEPPLDPRMIWYAILFRGESRIYEMRRPTP